MTGRSLHGIGLGHAVAAGEAEYLPIAMVEKLASGDRPLGLRCNTEATRLSKTTTPV
jgi:hypothetical protein